MTAVDQDGHEVVAMCANHPDEPATAETWDEVQVCEGCAKGLDARDRAAAEWDES